MFSVFSSVDIQIGFRDDKPILPGRLEQTSILPDRLGKKLRSDEISDLVRLQYRLLREDHHLYDGIIWALIFEFNDMEFVTNL